MLFSKKKKKTSGNGKIIVGEGAKLGRANGYNRLIDNVLYMNADGKNKVIQIESAVSAEGKTTVVSNLAVGLGLTDKKVAVIDLDFRRPRVHRLFELNKEVGIAEYVLGGAKIEDIIKKTKYKNVDVITRGAEIYNSALVFVSEKFKALIEKIRSDYDYVLLDCASVLQFSDYIHVSKISDGVLFLVAYASTTKAQVTEVMDELKKNGANVLGAVFTMYDWKKDKNFGGGYYDYSYCESDASDEAKENA